MTTTCSHRSTKRYAPWSTPPSSSRAPPLPRASRRRTSMSIATEPIRYLDAINAGIADAMERDDAVVLIGIDVGAGGGIFTVTKGLHERFGAERILDTPIS